MGRLLRDVAQSQITVVRRAVLPAGSGHQREIGHRTGFDSPGRPLVSPGWETAECQSTSAGAGGARAGPACLDLAQCSHWPRPDRRDMNRSDKPRVGKDKRPPKLSRSEEARRIIQEYVENLRKIVKKLRRRLN